MATSPLQDMKKLVSMKLTPKKKDSFTDKSCAIDAPDVPWGLRVGLNKDSLEKLKLDATSFKVKDKVMIMAEAEVCEIRSSSSEYDDSQNVELKIVNMAVTPKKTTRS